MKVEKGRFYWVQWLRNPHHYYLVKALEDIDSESFFEGEEYLVDVKVVCDTRADPLPDIGHTPLDKMHDLTDDFVWHDFEEDFMKMKRVVKRIFDYGYRGEKD